MQRQDVPDAQEVDDGASQLAPDLAHRGGLAVGDLGGQRVRACLRDVPDHARLPRREAGLDAEVEAADRGVLQQDLLLPAEVIDVEGSGCAAPKAVGQVGGAVVAVAGDLDLGQPALDGLQGENAVSEGLVGNDGA